MAGEKLEGETIVVKGLKPLLKAAKDAGSATNHEVRAALRESGEILRADAAEWIEKGWVPPKYGGAKYRARSAAGLKVGVRQRGVRVYQSISKTTGQHGQFGAYQMRRLAVGLKVKEPEIEAQMEKALDKIARIFNE